MGFLRLSWFPAPSVCLGILEKEGEVPWRSGKRSREQPDIKARDPECGQSWGWARRHGEGSEDAQGDAKQSLQLTIPRQGQAECNCPSTMMPSVILSRESWATFVEEEGR